MDCLEQILTTDCYSRQEMLVFRDCDARGRARMGTLLSLVASTAGRDYDVRGLGYRKLYELRQMFLLSRITLRIFRHPVTDEVLTITTWENGTQGVRVLRNFEMRDHTGALCVSVRSEWIIVDPVDRKIVRPSLFRGKGITPRFREVDCPECRKVVLPTEGLTELGTRVVRYSDLDYNGHVYSGNYGDILWDALPVELQNAPVREFTINYNREATLGEELRLAGVRNGRELLAGGLCGGEHCFTCQCEFGEERAE